MVFLIGKNFSLRSPGKQFILPHSTTEIQVYEGMIPINIHHLQFGRKRIKTSVSFTGRKPETVIRSFSFVSYLYFHS